MIVAAAVVLVRDAPLPSSHNCARTLCSGLKTIRFIDQSNQQKAIDSTYVDSGSKSRYTRESQRGQGISVY